jgi:ketosteroid isomerase-like protein
VQVAESGEMATQAAPYTFDYTNAKGANVNGKGKYLEVWKNVDGKWECHLDMCSSNLPLK